MGTPACSNSVVDPDWVGYKVSGTQSKFPNLNENGQKSFFFCEAFLTQNPVNILPRSAIGNCSFTNIQSL